MEMVQDNKHKKLLNLFLPIFAETFLLMLAGLVDSVMISRISDDAVGAVGTANTYVGLIFLVFAIVSNGLLAVMTQYIGAGKKGVAFQARQLAIILNLIFGLSFSLGLGFGARALVNALGVSEALRDDAAIYIRIVGAGCLLDALIPVFSSYLRAFDKTKYTLIAAGTGNVINLGLDALFLFVFKWGVMGVAIATIIGKVIILGLCLLFGHILIHGLQYTERVSRKLLVKQIIKIGLPSAIEVASYSISMAVVMTLLNRMDASGFYATAKSYVLQITSFSYCTAFAIGQANVIMTGWSVGKGQLKECYPLTLRAALIGIGAGIVVETIFALSSFGFLPLLTDNEQLAKTIRIVLFIDIALEIGRAAYMVYGNTLKSTGDSFFPMYISVPITLTLAIGGTYLFGTVCKLGVIGSYIALALDECIRGLIIFFRWKTGKWEQKVLIKKHQNEQISQERIS